MSQIARSGPDRDAELAVRLRALTPARVGLGRTGVSLATCDHLEFQSAHALARDAVHARLETAALAARLRELTGCEVLRLHSAAADRVTYLQRPDLGRALDAASASLLAQHAPAHKPNGDAPYISPLGTWEQLSPAAPASGFDLALIVADGLSALAVERHAVPVMAELLPRLAGWRIAPPIVVEQGRVAIGDAIGAALGAQIAVVLLGERPGLSAPDSLGAYITWEPRAGRTDAERNCISNIRSEGLTHAQAAAEIGVILNAARQRRLTGVALKQTPLIDNH